MRCSRKFCEWCQQEGPKGDHGKGGKGDHGKGGKGGKKGGASRPAASDHPSTRYLLCQECAEAHGTAPVPPVGRLPKSNKVPIACYRAMELHESDAWHPLSEVEPLRACKICNRWICVRCMRDDMEECRICPEDRIQQGAMLPKSAKDPCRGPTAKQPAYFLGQAKFLDGSGGKGHCGKGSKGTDGGKKGGASQPAASTIPSWLASVRVVLGAQPRPSDAPGSLISRWWPGSQPAASSAGGASQFAASSAGGASQPADSAEIPDVRCEGPFTYERVLDILQSRVKPSVLSVCAQCSAVQCSAA